MAQGITPLARREFTPKTKRLAWERSGGRCEASGPLYNRPFDIACGADLIQLRVEYDHFIRAADGGDNSLDNCRAVCPECHAWKTRKVDTPGAAKSKRVRIKHGIDPAKRLRPKPKIPQRQNAWGDGPNRKLRSRPFSS